MHLVTDGEAALDFLFHRGAFATRKPGEFGAYREAVSRIALYWLGANHPPPPRAFDGDGA